MRDDERRSKAGWRRVDTHGHRQRSIQAVLRSLVLGIHDPGYGGHFAIFFFFPELTAEDVSINTEQLEAIELPPEIEIPPPPEAIARPATPVIASAEIDEDITIAPTTFEDNPVEDLPPPPEEVTTTDISAAPTFTPYTVRPDIKNRDAVARALEREYPPLLRDAGIGGTVQVWFFIDEQGKVVKDGGE